jgi:hypothetical protein
MLLLLLLLLQDAQNTGSKWAASVGFNTYEGIEKR